MFSGEENASEDPKVVFTVGNEAAAADRDGKLPTLLFVSHITLFIACHILSHISTSFMNFCMPHQVV